MGAVVAGRRAARGRTAVAAGRVHVLPDVSAYGGVLAGLRFAELISAALTTPANGLPPR